jgi:hypothetical protein
MIRLLCLIDTVPDFSKFSGQHNITTIEHISKFLFQCGEASGNDALKIRLFPLSLSGLAFAWFSLLPANSIITWANLEKLFHKYFFARVQEMKLTDLTAVKQRNDEPVLDFVQRFRNIKSRCNSLTLNDSQLAKLAFQGLLPQFKERFSKQEFDSLSHLAQRLSNAEVCVHNPRGSTF